MVESTALATFSKTVTVILTILSQPLLLMSVSDFVELKVESWKSKSEESKVTLFQVNGRSFSIIDWDKKLWVFESTMRWSVVVLSHPSEERRWRV